MKIVDHYKFKQEYRFFDQHSDSWMTEEKCLETECGLEAIRIYFMHQLNRSDTKGLHRGHIPRSSNLEKSKEDSVSY